MTQLNFNMDFSKNKDEFIYKLIVIFLSIAIQLSFINSPVANSKPLQKYNIILTQETETILVNETTNHNDLLDKFAKDFIDAKMKKDAENNYYLSLNAIEEKYIKETPFENIIFRINTSITKNSGLTADEFNMLINFSLQKRGVYENSKFIGLGETLYQSEQNNPNINALFCLAIMTQESGWGHSYSATHRNNLAGLMKSGKIMYFNEAYQSAEYQIKLLHNNYIGKGLTTITDIGKKYCPPTYQHWSANVNCLLNTYISDIYEISNNKI